MLPEGGAARYDTAQPGIKNPTRGGRPAKCSLTNAVSALTPAARGTRHAAFYKVLRYSMMARTS